MFMLNFIPIHGLRPNPFRTRSPILVFETYLLILLWWWALIRVYSWFWAWIQPSIWTSLRTRVCTPLFFSRAFHAHTHTMYVCCVLWFYLIKHNFPPCSYMVPQVCSLVCFAKLLTRYNNLVTTFYIIKHGVSLANLVIRVFGALLN